jgi:hypothetical protein
VGPIVTEIARRSFTEVFATILCAPARPVSEEVRKVHHAFRQLVQRGGEQLQRALGVILTEGIADDAWPSILERMAHKVPGLIEEKDAPELADWIVSWRRRPVALARAFPHHSPELFFKEAYY